MTGTDVRAGSCRYLLNQQTLNKISLTMENEQSAVLTSTSSTGHHGVCEGERIKA